MSVVFKANIGQNWLITPVALAVHEPPPASISLQKWQVVLTGVGLIDFQGNNPNDWRRDTLSIFPNIINDPLSFVIQKYGIPRKNPLETTMGFELDLWAPFVAPTSTFSRETGTVDAGFAVDDWRPAPFNSGTDAVTGTQVKQVWNGVLADLAVRNNNATMHRVSYHITLAGRIVFLNLD
jgi:hypothetical protein